MKIVTLVPLTSTEEVLFANDVDGIVTDDGLVLFDTEMSSDCIECKGIIDDFLFMV